MSKLIKTIEELLFEVREDKVDNLSTTSFKFKTEVWNYFKQHPKHYRYHCVEFGTHKGQTTRILSHLFEQVYTINLPNHFGEAMELNRDRDNIVYCSMDLYNTPIYKNFTHKPITVFFIDAVHTFDSVMYDFSRCLEFKHYENNDVYFIFDDYGAYREVWTAVNQLIRINKIEKVCYIGHEPRHSFGGTPERILQDHEGIICKLK